MIINKPTGLWAPVRLTAMAAVTSMVWGVAGCMTPSRLSMQAERYYLQVRLDPTTHHLVGRTEMNLVRTDQEIPTNDGAAAVELLLHPDLEITRITASGATVKRHRIRRGEKEEGFTPVTHEVVLTKPAEAITLFVDYGGKLFQDVSAGEKPGQIHNFEMRAHIGEDGIYLGDGYWYPEPVADDDAVPRLADYTLAVEPVPGIELVAGAERDRNSNDDMGRLIWRSPYPLDGMVLVGGAHEIHRAEHHDLAISVHLQPSQARHADGLIDAVKRYLDRYEPLVGPYPATEYAIVDNFFSSGFAFPTFTLLSSAVINMGERAQTRHGFLDHEMLHCWWGNGIHVDPQDGNWCEALTSYATNYYGYVLDGDEVNARRKRRNSSHFLSRIEPDRDKPLGTFDREDGAGRGIGYNKGAMFFHMLARTIGQDTFWAAMRRFTRENVGRYASWENIRQVCEQESGMSLVMFFHQWVRQGGAPKIILESARYDSAEQALALTLSQGEPGFDLDLPVRITHADGTLDVDVRLQETVQEVTLPVEVIPLTVEVDPDYHIFRKVALDEIVPTTIATRHGTAFATVLPQGDVPESYTTLQSVFENDFEEDECRTLVVGDIEEGALAERCVLVVGEAVHDPYVAAFLGAIEFPVRWLEDGFELADTRYTDPGDAVLATASHPGVPGGGVTVVYANSAEAFPNPRHVTFYDRSVVVFKNKRPMTRRDLEHRKVVPVEKL